MKKLIYLISLLTISVATSYSQIDQQIRKEFDMDETDATSVIVVGEKGLITYGYHKERGAKSSYQINSFDSDLEMTSSLETDAIDKASAFRVVLSQDSSTIYFYQQAKNKDILINVYDVESNSVETRNYKLEMTFYPSIMTEVNGMLLFYGTSSKKPTFLTLNPNTGQQTMTPMPGLNKRRSLESFVRDETGNSATVLYRDGKDIKKSTLFLSILTIDGDFSEPVELDRDLNYSIIDGTITWLNETDFILAGTYGTRNNYYATGMYVSRWSNYQQDFITYHSFTDFEKFYDYLPAKQQARVEKRVEKKKSKGKENIVKSLVTIHPAMLLDNSIAIVGEVYHATYRTETYTTYVNGKPTTTTRQVFDGYQYTHAVVMGINFEGGLEYDHCFPMYMSYKPYTPRRNLRIKSDKSTMDIFFSNASSISATTIDGSDISTREVGKITTELEGDDKVYTSGSSSQFWYDNYYIVYCFQRIKNKTNDAVDRKRNVFVLTKIQYED